MKHPHLPVCVLLLTACAGPTTATPEQEQRLAEARALLATDPDGALAVTDGLLQAAPDWREARLLLADGSMQLATLGRSNTRELLEDAATNYERVLQGDAGNIGAWLGLASARYQRSQFLDARRAAMEAVNRLNTAGQDQTRLPEALLLAGRSQVQLFVELRQQELQDGKPDAAGFVRPASGTVEAAQQALQILQPLQRANPGEGYPLAARVYQWLNQNDNARLELERGLRAAPAEAALHIAYQDFYTNAGDLRAMAGAYNRLVREQADQPILLWYQGRAQVILGDDHRQRGAFQPAVDAYRKANDCFGQYKAMTPAHAASADEWRAICLIAIARTAIDMGDLRSATESLFAAADASPKTVEYGPDGAPALRDSFGAHFTGVVFQINRALAESGADALQRTLAFNEEVIRRYPGRWGFVYNNAALPARDLGVALETQAKAEGTADAERQQLLTRAMELWERSYALYTEAARLSPEDPRIVNDCGVLLVYHLHREYERARQLFDAAIAVGQRQLDALAADAPKSEREFLEEAVGDAWQNIAVLLTNQQRPWDEVRPFCEKAVQFFPYQQRAAAAMLRNGGRAVTAAAPGGGQGGNGGVGQQDPERQARFQKAATEARQQAGAGDLDGALATLDGVAKELKDFAPFCALRGELTLQYALQRRDGGQTSGLEFLFADAVNLLKRAVELDAEPVAPRQLLAQAHYENGAFEEAAQAITALLLHMQSMGGGKAEDQAAAHRLRAQAAGRAYMAQKGEGKDRPDLLTDMRTSFRFLEGKALLDQDLRTVWATAEQWAGAPAEAVNVWARALRQNPDDQTLLATMADTAVATGQASLAMEALKDRTDPFGLWYFGKAAFTAAHDLYSGGQHDAALAQLDTAAKAFERSMAGNAAFAESCKQWLAMTLGKKGCVAYAAERWDDAEKWLLESAALRPDRIAENLGGADSTKRGILLVADRYYGKDLGRMVQIYQAAAAAAPADDQFQNNLGLFARDHGNAVERAGRKDEAMKLYEISYEAYTAALRIDPSSVRLHNDRALMMIHHLKRDWDESRRLLDRGIELGEKQLQDNPPADREERNVLEEALGDCYENLALWHLEHSKDAAAAKAAATRSLDFHPGARRPGARRHLRTAEELLKKSGGG